jgi:hypothetical protein
MKFNAICCVGLFCCRSIKIGNLVLVSCLLVENPQSLAGDGITFRRDAMAVTENKYRGYGWLLRG